MTDGVMDFDQQRAIIIFSSHGHSTPCIDKTQLQDLGVAGCSYPDIAET